MRILHLSAADHGGAGEAAVRLHAALLEAGHTSRMLVWNKRGTDDTVEAVQPRRATQKFRRFAARVWARISTRRKYLFQFQRVSTVDRANLLNIAKQFAPEMAVVHYIANFVSFDDIREIHQVTGARIVWNLLDMAHLTGGCHYAWDCSGYHSDCGSCPALRLRPKDDASRRVMYRKLAALQGRRDLVIAASTMLHDQTKASRLFRDADVRHIMIGIDQKSFPLIERSAAREELGLQRGNRTLLIAAQSLRDERKGMRVLVEALAELASLLGPEERPRLLLAGRDSNLPSLRDLGFDVCALGYLTKSKLALAYAAADFFVCPSLEDSGPMMINESMMAGTPVIAFHTGVAPDLIVPEFTGLLATHKSAAALVRAVTDALAWDSSRLARSRTACRDMALRKCSPVEQVARLVAVHDERPDRD